MLLARELARSALPFLLLTTQTIEVDSRPGAKLSDDRTFSWLTGHPAPDDATDRRIVSAVEDELAVKGYFRDDEEPDLYLSYYVAIKSEVVIDSPYRTDWYDEGTIRVRRIHEGTLVLDVIDRAKNELLWRGTATRALTDDSIRNLSQIRDTVQKLLASFPSSAKNP